MFDGKTPQWYHFECFFKKQKPKTVDDIEHYESLRWEDQKKIKDNIRKFGFYAKASKSLMANFAV